jgi:hypothetical protein
LPFYCLLLYFYIREEYFPPEVGETFTIYHPLLFIQLGTVVINSIDD